MDTKLQEIILKIKHEDLMNMCLLLNDDVQKTIARYRMIKNGRDPEDFVRACVLEGEAQAKKAAEPKPAPVQSKPAPSQPAPAAAPAPPKQKEQTLVDLFADDPQPGYENEDPNPPPAKKPEPPKSATNLFDNDFDFGGDKGAPVSRPDASSDMLSKLNNNLNKMSLEEQ